MRRPSPLPPPPPRAEREQEPLDVSAPLPPTRSVGAATPDERVGADTEVEPSGAVDAAFADGETAPIVPLERPDGRDDSLSDPDPLRVTGEDTGRLGARDVWAAARARRRALRAEVRRFTARQRRRRITWIVSLSSVALLVLGSIGAAYSPLFAVEKIAVVGTSQLKDAAVEDALRGQLGRPLPLVDSSEVKAALVAFPLVESYSLEARPPHELVVRIVERTPIGTVKSAAGFTLVDAAGVALSTTPERPDDHPAISVSGGVGSSAFRAVGTVYRSLPADIRRDVTKMSATTPNDVTLTLGDTDTDVVWGSATESARKAVVLEAIMRSQPPENVSVYDVSSPGAVVVR